MTKMLIVMLTAFLVGGGLLAYSKDPGEIRLWLDLALRYRKGDAHPSGLLLVSVGAGEAVSSVDMDLRSILKEESFEIDLNGETVAASEFLVLEKSWTRNMRITGDSPVALSLPFRSQKVKPGQYEIRMKGARRIVKFKTDSDGFIIEDSVLNERAEDAGK